MALPKHFLTLMAGAVCAPVLYASAPGITIQREGERVKVTFSGTLESADTAAGPWTALTNAVSPFVVESVASQQFYRIRSSQVESIFFSRAVLEMTVTGPLQQHFDLAFAGTPDGIFPPVREKPYFDGVLALAGLELPVSFRVRGNSSLQECPFPKLKFKVSRENREGTPFFDAREVKIGTHCAEGGRGNVGRLRDERAAFREALVYETLELMGFISPRVRRARIEYRDASPTNDVTAAGWQIERNAFLLEDIEVVGERMGGRALSDEEIAGLTQAGFEEQLITELRLFHAMAGNWDFALSTDGQGIWNTDVIELSDGRLVPVAGDFDLSSWVTGDVRLSAPRDYRPDLPEIDREVRYRIEGIRTGVSAAAFATAAARFNEQRSGIEAQIGAAEVDEQGRMNALRHVTAFFNALNSL